MQKIPVAFNHDGFGMLAELADTPMSPDDARRILIEPLANSHISVIDWAICSTGVHNCRTRFRRDLDPAFVAETHRRCPGVWLDQGLGPMADAVATVVEHYNVQQEDLLDIVINASHAAGMKLFGCLRLNHSVCTNWLKGVPGTAHANGLRRDFRDPDFQAYLLDLLDDLLARGVDGLTLDFERKAPFFPDHAPIPERMEACTRFLRQVRRMTEKPLVARVSHQAETGTPQGQSPEQWLAEGLLDIIVPATHNHAPDQLDWGIERFLQAATSSPRPCQVWPQIWPTPVHWSDREGNLHPPDAVRQRVRELLNMGADGIYFFNFCCFGSHSPYVDMYKRLLPVKANHDI